MLTNQLPLKLSSVLVFERGTSLLHRKIPEKRNFDGQRLEEAVKSLLRDCLGESRAEEDLSPGMDSRLMSERMRVVEETE